MIVEENGILYLEFGTGDILVAGGWQNTEKKIPTCSFFQAEPGKIGRYFDNLKGMLDTEVPFPLKVKMIFNDIKSIDIVIEQLEIAKKEYSERKDEKESI